MGHLRSGQRVNARFEIEQEAGSGGMGTVYRALDVASGAHVALKVLQRASADDRARFAREARALSSLEHAGVVRYVAHGATEDGAPYIAMEWLDGEDLSTRLARAPLTMSESVTISRQVAEIIASIHARKIVHRDLKPANIFLEGRDPTRVKLLDFGVARLDFATIAVTREGVGLGTPGYMAPEQARGARDVDARADLFSLGCVLFECVTGEPAWSGESVMAVLAKVLFSDAPRLRDHPKAALHAPGALVDALDLLVHKMLRRESSDRPESAAAVASALASLETLSALASPSPSSLPPSLAGLPAPSSLSPSARLTAAERRMVFVLLVRAPPRRALHDVETLAEGDAGLAQRDAPTPALGAAATLVDEDAALRALITEYGGVCHKLADGTWAATIVDSGAALEQAARAAKCAIAARSILANRPSALATGRARVSEQGGLSEVIDRAARLLGSSAAVDDAPLVQGEHASAPIWIDEPTAALLDGRFRVESTPAGLLLLGESDAPDDARTLLGRRTPCVGRDRELRALLDTFDACASEPAAHVALITGAAGVGKSRLRHELMASVRDRSPSAEVWIARGDPMRAGPLGLLAQLIRRAARLADGEPIAELHAKLRARVLRHVDSSIARRVTEFLGEIVGARFSDEGSVQLRAARRDAALMGDQMRAAWLDFVEAESTAGPVLLIFEDLHWGDAPSIDYVDSALRVLRDSPLMVLGLARPEVDEVYPKLWAERGITKTRLGELSRRACDRLAREVLGAAATEEALKALWDRSAGNAFFLEELMRAVAEGRGDELPSTVAAMVHSRLTSLDALSRRTLRAGSIFGHAFWRGALSALLGVDERSLSTTVADLEARELVTQQRESSFQGEVEYRFRHALVRDAAYAMLTEEDSALGHRLAAHWLKAAGEQSAAVIAEHFDRGGERSEAAEWYRRAAEQALASNDLEAVLTRVDRALDCGASGEAAGELSLLRAHAHIWKGNFALAERSAIDAMAELPKHAERWFDALGCAAEASAKLGHIEGFHALADELMALWSIEGVRTPQVIAAVHVAANLRAMGDYARSDTGFTQIDSLESQIQDDPLVRAHLCFAHSFRAYWAGELVRSIEWSEATALAFDEAGDSRQALFNRTIVASGKEELGRYDEIVQSSGALLSPAKRMGLQYVVVNIQLLLANSLERTNRHDEALRLAAEAVAACEAMQDVRTTGGARRLLASLLARSGALDAAAVEARRAVETLAVAPPLRPHAVAILAQIELARGNINAALEHASTAINELTAMGQVEDGETVIWLTYAAALFASGDRERAAVAITGARARLLERASKISDPAWRKSFLENVPENARTLELAKQWLEGGGCA